MTTESQFLQLHASRAPNMMWLLGAGASAAAGIPTAYNMIWDFKRRRYCAEQRVSLESCADISSSSLQLKLQSYLDARGNHPPQSSDDEYAHYFEQVMPAELDRRRYIQQLVALGTPSYGHLALAALLTQDRVRVVWTTNFDRMVEDAAYDFLPTSGRLTVATPDTARVALESLNEGRWPLLVKLHGDFQSRRLRNTTAELQSQDAELRFALTEAGKRFGLAVVGYSGRDHSVMAALEEIADTGRGFPFGLYWFHRPDTPVLPQVQALIERCQNAGIEANLIPVETFDELLADLLLLEDVPEPVRKKLAERKPRVSDAPVPDGGGTWPVIRTNALPLLTIPTLCRRVVCGVGGAAEVQQTLRDSGADVVAARRNIGVLAFGRDSQVRKAFARFGIREFDLQPIETERLAFESAEHGLLYEALSRALARERPVVVERRGHSYFMAVAPDHVSDSLFAQLRRAVRQLTGTVPGTESRWAEAVRLRIELRLQRSWLLIEPTVLVERPNNGIMPTTCVEFVRSRLAGRYNSDWNDILAAWADVITAEQPEAELHTFGIGDGVDAAFTIANATAFSRRRRADE